MKPGINRTIEERQQSLPSPVGCLKELIGFPKLVGGQWGGLRCEFCSLGSAVSLRPPSRLIRPYPL